MPTPRDRTGACSLRTNASAWLCRGLSGLFTYAPCSRVSRFAHGRDWLLTAARSKVQSLWTDSTILCRSYPPLATFRQGISTSPDQGTAWQLCSCCPVYLFAVKKIWMSLITCSHDASFVTSFRHRTCTSATKSFTDDEKSQRRKVWDFPDPVLHAASRIESRGPCIFLAPDGGEGKVPRRCLNMWRFGFLEPSMSKSCLCFAWKTWHCRSGRSIVVSPGANCRVSRAIRVVNAEAVAFVGEVCSTHVEYSTSTIPTETYLDNHFARTMLLICIFHIHNQNLLNSCHSTSSHHHITSSHHHIIISLIISHHIIISLIISHHHIITSSHHHIIISLIISHHHIITMLWFSWKWFLFSLTREF